MTMRTATPTHRLRQATLRIGRRLPSNAEPFSGASAGRGERIIGSERMRGARRAAQEFPSPSFSEDDREAAFAGRSSGSRVVLLPRPSRSFPTSGPCVGFRHRLQRRDRAGFAPASLFTAPPRPGRRSTCERAEGYAAPDRVSTGKTCSLIRCDATFVAAADSKRAGRHSRGHDSREATMTPASTVALCLSLAAVEAAKKDVTDSKHVASRGAGGGNPIGGATQPQ